MPTQHSITLCCFSYSSLAQLAEHAAVNRRVVGSSPTGGAKSGRISVLPDSFLKLICGVYYGGDPPVPIPNTVVKPVRAEDTWRAASRENRSMPQQKSSDKMSELLFLSFRIFKTFF